METNPLDRMNKLTKSKDIIDNVIRVMSNLKVSGLPVDASYAWREKGEEFNIVLNSLSQRSFMIQSEIDGMINREKGLN